MSRENSRNHTDRQARWRRSSLGVLSLVALAGVVSHGTIIVNEFVWDDVAVIAENPRLAKPSFIKQVWFRDYGLEFGDHTPEGYYRPLLMALLTIERKVFGLRPVGYRLVSLATLIATAGVIAALVGRFSRRRSAAALAGCLYACHPIVAEPVALATSWPDLYLGLSLGGGLLLALKALGARSQAATAGLASSSAFLAFTAMVAKESAFLGAAGLLAGLAAVAPRKRFRAGGVAAAWAVAMGLAFWMRSRAQLGGPDSLLAPLTRPFTAAGAAPALWSVVLALRYLFIPGETPYLRPIDLGAAPRLLPAWATWAQGAMAVLALGAAALVASLVWRRRPMLASLAGWALCGSYSLVVACSLGLPYSDRYLAAAPILALAALGLARWVRGLRGFPAIRGALGINRAASAAWLVLAVCAALSIKSGSRAFNPKTFWLAAANDALPSAAGHISMARFLMLEGDLDGMAREALTAIEQDPDGTETRELGPNLGLKATIEKEPAEALRWYEWTLAARPWNIEARKGRVVALHQLGRSAEARQVADEARRAWPDDAKLAFLAARVWIESPDAPPETAIARARQARSLGATIPDEWLTTRGVERARRGTG